MKIPHHLKRKCAKIFYPKNNYDSIKSLSKPSYIYASLLATKVKMCFYTNKVLPSAFMIRFVKAINETNGDIWLTPDDIYGEKKNGKGIWLKCSKEIFNSFIKEKFHRKIDKRLKIRSDLNYHVYYLFNLEILNLFKNIKQEQLTYIHQKDNDIVCYLNFKMPLIPKQNIDIIDIKYPKEFNLPNCEMQFIDGYPFFQLNQLLHPNILFHVLSMPIFSSFITNLNVGVTCTIGLKLNDKSLQLITNLYRLNLFLK